MLNTEMGLVIESPELAQQIHHRFTQSQQKAAWTLELDHRGRINWVEYRDGQKVVFTKEPKTRFWQRVLVKLAYWLPVEWLL